jgi:uncharacterized protein (TIGR02757 family)
MTHVDKARLDQLYDFYNSREWVHPDPLEFLYQYPRFEDREVVGLIASSLAYGRVNQILKSVSVVLEAMGSSPRRFIEKARQKSLRKPFIGFKHRFTTGEELIGLLMGIKGIIGQYGSLYAGFCSHFQGGDETVLPALCGFVEELKAWSGGGSNSLLPPPQKGSACKRLNLFLRWMVRVDQVDPGGWHCVSPAKLIVPLDTHMHRIGLELQMTNRKQTSMRTAMDITNSLRAVSPGDPVRYDFALTRIGIRGTSLNQRSVDHENIHNRRHRLCGKVPD